MAIGSWRFLLLISAALSLTGFSSSGANAGLPDSQAQVAPAEPVLSEAEMRQFLLKAKVIGSKTSSKGITRPSRLTLSDGRITHDASFQSVNVSKSFQTLDNGTVEINFRDSYHFNIAAYELAKLLGLERMMPVTVERKWEGKIGSLSWWLKVKMDERDRLEKQIHPPDPEAWNAQMHRKRVFAHLVYDADPNLTNVLIGENWEIYMIDFSRAFRLREDLANVDDLVRCDRQLLDRLRQLSIADVQNAVKNHLGSEEVKALIKRRGKLVAHYEQLVAQKGEDAVLY
jgi:hypothetical protein